MTNIYTCVYMRIYVGFSSTENLFSVQEHKEDLLKLNGL